MDPISIAAAVEGLKRASEIVRALSQGDLSLEKAELKLRLADLIGELASARLTLVATSETLKEKESEISRLQSAIRLKDDVVREGDAYYSKDAEGHPAGDPYCSHCFEAEGRLFHLTESAEGAMSRVCPHCKHAVHKRRSYIQR